MQPLDLQVFTIPHLKDLIHICLESEDQRCGMTFNKFYVGSKYPYFISYRGKWLYLFCRGCMYKPVKIEVEVVVVVAVGTRSIKNFAQIANA